MNIIIILSDIHLTSYITQNIFIFCLLFICILLPVWKETDVSLNIITM